MEETRSLTGFLEKFNFRKFWAIASFEVDYQSGRLSTWIYLVVILFLSSFWILGYVDFARDLGLKLNSTFIVYSMTAFPQLFALLVIPAMAADAGMRDIQSRLYTLYYTTALGKMSYILGRFCGIWFLSMVMMIAAVPLGIILSTWIGDVENSLFGTFKISSYLNSFLLLTAPNLFVANAIVFSAVLLTRNAITGYLAALFLFLCSVAGMDGLAGTPGYADLANLLDFSGATILKEIRISAAYKSTTEFADFFILNRIIWLSFALVLIATACLQFKLRYYGINKNRKIPVAITSFSHNHDASKSFDVKVVSRNYGYKARIQQILEIQIRCYLELIKSPVSIAILIMSLILIFVLPTLLTDPSGEQQVPMTGKLISLLDNPFNQIVMATVTSLFAGQLVWREREKEINELFDAAPIPNYVTVIGKFLALFLMLITIQTVFMATGIVVQLLLGYSNFEFPLYVQTFYVTQLLQYLLFSALAFALHVFLNQKYLGHVMVLLFYFYTTFSEKLGIQHDLLVFGSPFLPYPFSFNSMESEFLWILYKLHWLTWSFLLMILATLLTIRGQENGLGIRWRRLKENFVPPTVVVSIIVVIATAGLILFNS